jgi:KipI family sensor histidine kinase inhibitor
MVSVLPMGDRALLVELDSLAEVMAVHAALAATRPAGIVDVVPAARTVMVRIDPAVTSLAAARSWVSAEAQRADAATGISSTAPAVTLDVVYDGPDLSTVAATLGLSVEALVERHLAARWSVAFSGFAPGFGYLVSADWTFAVPRLDTPRTRVPAGSVGLAGEFSGVYPRESPGGWQIIGTSQTVLFDADAASPALLVPGTPVRFAPQRAVITARGEAPTAGAADPALRVLEPGLLATVQDLGREGAASLGVAASGALDRGALRTANRLVGNAESAAGIEVTMGGLRAVALHDAWVAVTGAWGEIRLDGVSVDPYTAHRWPAGSELHLDWFAHGARAYVAVRGGVAAPLTIGSRSTDVMSGLGPARLGAGSELPLGDAAIDPIPVAPPPAWGAPHDDELVVELAPGPRADWFTPAARAALFETVWTASNDADRVGLRLEGPALERLVTGELPSEGMVAGALQVPPSGTPVILLADGPVTGGYPVIAVVAAASLDLLAQARPGTRLRFRHAHPAE